MDHCCGTPEDAKDTSIEVKTVDNYNPTITGIPILECNYDKNPHALYLAIKTKKWLGAHKLLESVPDNDEVTGDDKQRMPREEILARTWIVRSKDDGAIKWRITPLHAAVISNAPAYIIDRLIAVHPMGAQLRDDQGNLPLHLAYRDGLNQEKIDLLEKTFPGASEIENQRGYVPSSCGAGKANDEPRPDPEDETSVDETGDEAEDTDKNLTEGGEEEDIPVTKSKSVESIFVTAAAGVAAAAGAAVAAVVASVSTDGAEGPAPGPEEAEAEAEAEAEKSTAAASIDEEKLPAAKDPVEAAEQEVPEEEDAPAEQVKEDESTAPPPVDAEAPEAASPEGEASVSPVVSAPEVTTSPVSSPTSANKVAPEKATTFVEPEVKPVMTKKKSIFGKLGKSFRKSKKAVQ